MPKGKVNRNLGWNNLNRGNVPAERFDGKPRVPKNPKGAIHVIQAARERDDQVMQLARDDPERVQEELYAELSRAALRLTRKLNNTGGEPSRLLIEAWREVRQAGLVVLEIRRSRGSVAEAEAFFAELQTRMESLAPYLGDGVYATTDDLPDSFGDDDDEAALGPSGVLDDAGDVRGGADTAGPMADGVAEKP